MSDRDDDDGAGFGSGSGCIPLDCFKSPFIFFFLSHSSVVFSKFFASCDTPGSLFGFALFLSIEVAF